MWMEFGDPENHELELIDPSTDAVREATTSSQFHLFNTGVRARQFVKAQNTLDGLVVMREWFMQERIWVHPSCSNLIRELEHYKYPDYVSRKVADQHNPKERPIKKHDHAIDALRYVANYLSLRENTLDTDEDKPLPYDFLYANENKGRYMNPDYSERVAASGSIYD